jgi:hypothetical protein
MTGAIVAFLILSMQQAPAQQPQPQPQSPPPPRFELQPQTPPTVGEPATAPAVQYDQGPLRLELMAMMETRPKLLEQIPNVPKESSAAMRFRVQGERIDQVSRIGNVILSEAVDDTGKQLFDPASVTEADKTTTRAVTLSPERLKSGGLTLDVRLTPAAARQAKSIKKLRGNVRLFVAGPSEEITIENPRRFENQVIDHPRLKELGLTIRLIPPAEMKQLPQPERALVIQMKDKAEYVKSRKFVDASMKQIRAREQQSSTDAGEPATVCLFEPGQLNDEIQLVLDVYSKVEEVNLPVQIDNFELP